MLLRRLRKPLPRPLAKSKSAKLGRTPNACSKVKDGKSKRGLHWRGNGQKNKLDLNRKE